LYISVESVLCEIPAVGWWAADRLTVKMWHLYMVRCRNDSLYSGIATDVVRRFAEHAAQGKKCARYLRGKAPLELVFTVVAGTHSEAARLEALVKKVSKADKELLVRGQKSLAALVGRQKDG
jgi:putative endonuclease